MPVSHTAQGCSLQNAVSVNENRLEYIYIHVYIHFHFSLEGAA